MPLWCDHDVYDCKSRETRMRLTIDLTFPCATIGWLQIRKIEAAKFALSHTANLRLLFHFFMTAEIH